jgi:methionyl-tRNA formyltransferase
MVVTRADKRRGRGGELSPSPVSAAAASLGIPVVHRVDDALSCGASLGVVVAFGQIIKPHVLAALPMVNLHFSLLPRWRGAAPVERAILAGDTSTGVCVMEVEEGLDTGGVYASVSVPILPSDTSDSLRSRLVDVGTPLLVSTLSAPLGVPAPQVGEATYADKVTAADLVLDFSLPAVVLERRIRAGKAWTLWRGAHFSVLSARVVPSGVLAPGVVEGTVVGTASGGLELLVVQPAGKQPMPAAAWANGARLGVGATLGL